MRGKGITYDTGAWPGGCATRPVFDPETVRRDMRVIAEELHGTSVRVTGGDPERLSIAARHAAAAGLEVWFAPFPCELPPDRLIPLLAGCARRAEEVRRSGARVVFVTGAELSVFARGFLPGADLFARLGAFTPERARTVPGPLNAFLAAALTAVRKEFGGPVTYGRCRSSGSTGTASTTSARTRTGPRTTPAGSTKRYAPCTGTASRSR